MSKSFGTVFSKRTFVQSLIVSNTLTQQQKSGDRLLDFVRGRSGGDSPPASAASSPVTTTIPGGPSPPPSKVDMVLEIWELQRRMTLFHTSWQAPFLPHDSEKQFRWVDKSYARHDWMPGTMEDISAANTPPIKAPDGWQQSESWSVVEALGCEEGGWQYALDFYTNDSWWGAAPSLCQCRRRLWRCTFKQPSMQQFGGAAAPKLPMPSAEHCPRGGTAASTGSGKSFTEVETKPVEVSPTSAFNLLARPTDLTPILEACEVPSLDLAKEAQLLFADEWQPGNLLMDWLSFSDVSEVEVAPWAAAPSPAAAADGEATRSGIRQISARLIVPPAPMAPKTTRATITYRIVAEERRSSVDRLCIETDFVLHDTPYCDCFHVHEQIVFQPSASGGTSMSKSFGTVFSKRTFVQSLIVSNTLTQQQKSGDRLLDFVRRRGQGEVSNLVCEASGPTDPQLDHSDEVAASPLATMKKNRIVEVWELQRRVTLFHKTWQAPFLPHDGEKQWRWVDMQYRMHPWAVGDKAECASRAFPVLDLPNGWKQREGCKGFEVVAPPGPGDAEGWQYAVDLYTSDELWFADPSWFHCRRRLWRMEVEVTCDADDGKSSEVVGNSPAVPSKWTRARCLAAVALLLLLLLLLLVLVMFAMADVPFSSSTDSCDAAGTGECSWWHGRLPSLPGTTPALGD
jgi:hypothetical protein